MKYMLLSFTFLILFVSNFNLLLIAQESSKTLYLTMEEAISRALDKNNKVLSSKYALKKAEWDTKRAWTQLFPTLNFNTRYTWIDEQTFAERDFRRYLPPDLANQFPQTVFQESYYSSFDVYVPIFNGAIINGLSIANEQEDMVEHLDRSTRQEIIFQVIRSYLNVLKARELVKLQEEYLDLSKLNYEKAERLFKANRYSQNEALRWKVDFQQQKSIVVSNQSTLRSNILILNRLMNYNLNESYDIKGKIPAQLEGESASLLSMTDEQLFELIKLSDEEIIELNAALSAAKSGEQLTKLLYKNSYANYLPNVSLSYSYGWRENNTLAFDDYSPKTLMVNFSVPIFTGFQNFTNLKSTLYEYKKSEEDFNDQLLNTKLILNEIVNRLINLKTQIDLSKSNVEYNENNYRIVEQQRDKGLASNIDFIDAKLNFQNAKLNEVTTHYDFIIAMVELYYLIGKIEVII